MRRTTCPSPSHDFAHVLLTVAVGLFAFGSFVYRPRTSRPLRKTADHLRPAPLATPQPAAALLASVAGEEDPGASVDAPAPPPAPSP